VKVRRRRRFSCITIAHNVREKVEVEKIAEAVAAGGKLIKGRSTPVGGRSGFSPIPMVTLGSR
jgi:hypothetical protein